MVPINREDIQIISRHSNLSEQDIDKILKEKVYSDVPSWQKFLRLLFVSLGVGFTTVGIIFFFAFNWESLHKFVKLGIIEFLVVVIIGVVLFTKLKPDVKNILLTCASILVGGLFAVFGQIYQTGANAYDFFLGWTIYTTLWVLVANFPPLWLLYIALINTTIVLYAQQVASDWPGVFVLSILFIINALFSLFFQLGSGKIKQLKLPNWFNYVLVLATITCSTIGIITGIFGSYHFSFPILVLLTAAYYFLGIDHGLKSKRSFYLAVIPFSVIIIISALLIEWYGGAVMFFLLSLFIVISVTLVIKNILNLQKKWKNERGD